MGSSEPIEFLIDSGADVNALSEIEWEKLSSQVTAGRAVVYDVKLNPEFNINAYAAAEKLEIIVAMKAWVQTCRKSKPRLLAEFVVVRNSKRSLLGRKTAIPMKLLAVGLEVNNLTKAPTQKTEFPSVPGIEIDFDVDESVPPVRHVYVSIPAHYGRPALERLHVMEANGIIERVKHAPRWISGLSAVPKGKNNFRLVVNMRGPNRAIRRQFHAMPRVEEIKLKLSGARLFTKLDLASAFHHVRLSQRSRELTTFMGPDGMYRFTRLVFGVNCAPEIFQRVMEDVLMGIASVVVYIDDILIFASDEPTLERITKQVLEALKSNNLTLNDDKCEFKKGKLEFLGHTVSESGLDIEERKIDSIRKFKRPTTPSELKSFLGLASYVSSFIPKFADLTDDLWKVSGKEAFEWGEAQEKAFVAVKEAIINCTTSQGFFSVNDDTYLYTDASPRALGAVLVQTDNTGKNRIISFASKTLTETERRYPQTQREALAVVWAAEHYFYYLLGQRFTIRTDAQGIAFIFKRDGDAPKRLMKRAEGWAMRLDAFDFVIEFVKGSDNIADPSSRLYEGEDEAYNETEAPCEIANLTITEPEEIIFGDECLTALEVSFHTAQDDELKEVLKAMDTGEWPKHLAQYENVQEELTEANGVMTKIGLAVIPRILRSKALHLAHKGHPGMTKMKSILRERVWWPGMYSAAETWVQSCRACTLNSRREHPTPMERTRLPEAPWEFVAVDFCGPYATIDNGVTIMGMVDYYSRYMLSAPMKQTDFATVRAWLNAIFDTFGFPAAIKSDNGPPFNSAEYRKYCADRGIQSVFSWPLTPQQNGTAERAMATIGKAMKNASTHTYRTELGDAMKAHNSAVHSVTNEIPENVMFGRRIRRSLPLLRSPVVDIDDSQMRNRDWAEKQKGKDREDKKRGARASNITVGDSVVLRRERQKKGDTNYDPTEFVVLAQRAGDLTVQAPDGRVVKRNIVMAKKISANDEPEDPVAPDVPVQHDFDAQSDRNSRPKRNAGRPRHLQDYVATVRVEGIQIDSQQLEPMFEDIEDCQTIPQEQ